ncbi:Efflux pump periplasmic linker BepF [compost metagenome]
MVQVGRDSFVYRVKADHSVERIDITSGARRAGVVEIRSGLTSGDRIVVDGTSKLRPGLKVEDRPAPVPAASAPADTAA